MSYKTILVHVDLGPGAAARIRFAARLACRTGAHLVGSTPTGVSRFLPPEVLAAGQHPLAARIQALRADAQRALACFDAIAAEEGVLSSETRLVDDEVDGGMAPQARYCDLVVVGQPDPGLVDPLLPPDLPAWLLQTGGHPVLVLPHRLDVPEVDGEALVAWDASPAATRAVAAALPLLRMARRVTVVGFGELPPTGLRDEACTALSAWLGRHGVTARPSRRPLPEQVGEALLLEALENGAGLLVMGAHGHSRLRETFSEGITDTVLRRAHLPVLLAH